MRVDISAVELRELARALDLHLERLQAEIVRTDSRELAESLKATYLVLGALLRRLASPSAEAQEFA
jgi:hypothetical protein